MSWHLYKTKKIMKKIKAIIETSMDGGFSIYMSGADDMNYLITETGDTIEEAKANFMAAYEDTKQYCIKTGEPFEEVEFNFEYDMESFLGYYSKVFTLVGLSQVTGINKCQLSHYLNGSSKPGARTMEKIRNSIHKFANQLAVATL